MSRSFQSSCRNILTRSAHLRSNLDKKGFKRLILDECGAMSIDGLAKEAIAVLVLIIVFAIVPKIGAMITTSLDKIGGDATSEAAKAWASAPDGAALWSQMAGIIQIAAVILIVAIIIRAVYKFKQSSR